MFILFSKFEEKIANFLQKGLTIYKRVKPYLALSIFWAFYIRGFLLLPYGNIFDVNLFFSIFSICYFLSFVNYALFFNLTLKVIEKILSFRWSRKWLGLYHILSAHLAFFPVFFFCLLILIGLYRAGVLDIDPTDTAVSSEVISKALREIGRPAFIIFFPLQLSHFLFKAFDWQAIGADDKTPYNVIFKKPGAKNVDVSMLNFIKKLEQQGKLSIYDDRSVVLDSLGQPDKENWMVCLYNEVLNSNILLIKKNKWYSPAKIELPSFFDKPLIETKINGIKPFIGPDSYFFYLSHGAIKNVLPDFNSASKRLTEHSKAILVATGALGTLGAGWAWQRDHTLHLKELELNQKKLEFKQKMQKDKDMLDIFDKRKTITDQALDKHVEAIAKKYECQNSRLSNTVCEKTYSDIVSIIENKKRDDLKELNRIADKTCPDYGKRFPLILENNENQFSFIKKLVAIFFG